MKNKILKWGFRYLIIIIVIGLVAIVIPNTMIEKELQTNETQEEVPLQDAVGDNEIIAKTTNSKRIVKKASKKKVKKTKKKTTKKVSVKKYTKSKVRKVSLNANASVTEMKQYAHQLVLSYGWSEYDWQCLVKIVNHESGWNANAVNKSSSACGLPQALPCSKMASAGADYKTNYKTQLKWLMGYIKGRYKTPSKAWSFWQKHHWY